MEPYKTEQICTAYQYGGCNQWGERDWYYKISSVNKNYSLTIYADKQTIGNEFYNSYVIKIEKNDEKMDLHKKLNSEYKFLGIIFIISFFMLLCLYYSLYDNQKELLNIISLENKNSFEQIKVNLNMKSEKTHCLYNDEIISCEKIIYNNYYGFGKYNLEITNFNGNKHFTIKEKINTVYFILFKILLLILISAIISYISFRLKSYNVVEKEKKKIKKMKEEFLIEIQTEKDKFEKEKQKKSDLLKKEKEELKKNENNLKQETEKIMNELKKDKDLTEKKKEELNTILTKLSEEENKLKYRKNEIEKKEHENKLILEQKKKEIINKQKEKEEELIRKERQINNIIINIIKNPKENVVSISSLENNTKIEFIKKINEEIGMRLKEYQFIYIENEKYILNPITNRLIRENHSKEFHRWLYFRYNRDTLEDYEIHHIDDNKLNNFLCNLVALKPEHHKELHKLSRENKITTQEALKIILEKYKNQYPKNYLKDKLV